MRTHGKITNKITLEEKNANKNIKIIDITIHLLKCQEQTSTFI